VLPHDLFGFDGDLQRPTFAPEVSLLVAEDNAFTVCCYSITKGLIRYSERCTHNWAGRALRMTVLPRLVVDNT
jgi:hypothetical protein